MCEACGQPEVRQGGIDELRLARAQWRRARQAEADLRALGRYEMADQLAAEAESRGAQLVAVVLSCVRCHQPSLASALVGDPQNGEPEAILCGNCNRETTEQVLGQARREGWAS